MRTSDIRIKFKDRTGKTYKGCTDWNAELPGALFILIKGVGLYFPWTNIMRVEMEIHDGPEPS